MRTFIALALPAEAARRLESLGAEITRIDASLRCQHAEKLHFTLEFLDEKSSAWIDKCRTALKPMAASFPPFVVSIRRIGFFPVRGTPRIIWAGSAPDENIGLCALASEVKRICAGLGHASDPKPFHPHITLTRVKTQLRPGVHDRIAHIPMEPIEFDCCELSIIKSTLASSGSQYELLSTVPLAPKGQG